MFFLDIKAEAKERGKERESKGIDGLNKREEKKAKRDKEENKQAQAELEVEVRKEY